jgi:hypothetical protein
MSLGKPTNPIKNTCGEQPCPTCPYRKDTPKGVWALDHYEALLAYDGEIGEQAEKGAFVSFGCHYDNGNLCRGWIDAHGANNLLALRLNPLRSPVGPPLVEVYGSGREVLEANLPHMLAPNAEAKKAMRKIKRRHKVLKQKK